MSALEAAWVPLALTLKVALWATAIDLVLGIAIGYALARSRWPGRALVDALLTLPMVLPPTVVGYYLLVLLGRQSAFGAWLFEHFGLRLVFTWQGAVIAAAVVALPFVVKPARAAFEGVDARLEQAARTLGVGEFGIFCRVTLPLAWRGILAGTLLAFARALGEFGATLMIAGSIPGQTQTLSIAVYEAVQAGRDADAALLTALLSGVAVLLLLIVGRLARGPVAAAARGGA